MSPDGPPVALHASRKRGARLCRLLPVAAIVLAMVAVYATGWHREISLETLVRHRVAIDDFIDTHYIAAVALFVGVYVLAVAISMPGAVFLTVSGGVLFGWVVGAIATLIGATLGATIIFEVARTACGESLARRAGPRAMKVAQGFREHAFSYLLFLRLVPLFPFFLVNIAPALVGVRLLTFVGATAIGIVPATFAFAMFGAGLDSVLAAQETMFRTCIAAGGANCRLNFDRSAAITPELIAALVALGIVALIPLVVRRWRAGADGGAPACGE